jgi:trehalose synthase
MPAINPFNTKNRQLSDKEIDERLAHYKIATDLPLVVQISRFDPWKGSEGRSASFQVSAQTSRCQASTARELRH